MLKALVLLLMFLSGYILYLVADAGYFREISDIKFGDCKSSSIIEGPEDMVQIPGEDHVLISSDLRGDLAQGDLFQYDLKTRQAFPLIKKLKLSFNFHPHGIDLFKTEDQILVYAINHRDKHHTTLEVFNWQSTNELKYIKSIEHPLLQSANDLALVSTESFYITSDFGSPDPLRKMIEPYTYIASGYISFFQNEKIASKVDEHIFFANGIAVSSDQRYLIAAAMLSKKVLIYERFNSEIRRKNTLSLEGAPDNITVRDNHALVAVHPNLLRLRKMSEQRRKIAPSKIISIENWQGEKPIQKVIYENSGEEISAASVALAIDPNHILIGSVFDNHILDCRK